MITVSNVTKTFNGRVVLDDVSFSLAEGQIAALIGPSGVGKSVLLKILAGVIRADKGEWDFQLKDRGKVSFMFQEGALFDSLSVFDNVAFPLVNGKVPSALLARKTREDVAEKVVSILEKVGLLAASAKLPGQLSGGMRRRLSLARALVTKPRILFLDDPTYGLDPVASSVIMELLVNIQKEMNATTIIVSHDLRRLLPISDLVYALFQGRIVYDGALRVLKDSANEQLKHFVHCRYDINSLN